MGLKFEKTDDLEKLFDDFAIEPTKKVAPNENIDKFLKPNKEEDKKKEKIEK